MNEGTLTNNHQRSHRSTVKCFPGSLMVVLLFLCFTMKKEGATWIMAKRGISMLVLGKIIYFAKC